MERLAMIVSRAVDIDCVLIAFYIIIIHHFTGPSLAGPDPLSKSAHQRRGKKD